MITPHKVNTEFLIIAGTSKAATTSLFGYLANHPQICPSHAKETRFFLDMNYPLQSQFRYEGGIFKYFDYFTCKNVEQIRLEASPDYLYSSNTAYKINSMLPNVSLLFVLREPISRLISWFKFGKLIRKIPEHMTFEEYVNCQLKTTDKSQKLYQHPAFMALKQGRYSMYLECYLDFFNKKRIYICFYEDFLSDSISFLKSICKFAQIDEEFFDGYRFETMRFIPHLRICVYDYKNIRKLMKRIRYFIEPVYDKINIKNNKDIKIPEPIMSFLKNYYAGEANRIKDLFSVKPPW
jgi:hypothetical protein